MKWLPISITIILFLVSNKSMAQTQHDVDRCRHLFDANNQKTSFKEYTSRGNEIKFIASTFFMVYKEFISSQDYISCVFHPSCSIYAIQAVQKQGVIGVFNAFDRLTRCNGLSPEHYMLHKETQLFYDPVE